MAATTSTRRFGVAVLGLLAGALVGFGLQEALARIVLGIAGGAFPASIGLGLTLAYLIPVLAMVGLFIALRIDTRYRQQSRSRQ